MKTKIKKKPKYITVRNYKQFKPSEFIRSFISDIEVAEKIGKPMNMSHFEFGRDYRCLPCLGGMACLNFGVSVTTNMRDGRLNFHGKISEITANLGDSIRLMDASKIIWRLRELYPGRLFGNELELEKRFRLFGLRSFRGNVTTKDLKKLKELITIIADFFEEQGY